MSAQAAPVALEDLQGPLRAQLEAVEAELERIVAADFPLISEVNTHLLQMRGKMFRPMLVLLATEASGVRHPRAVTLASIIELVHLATLVHDDAVDHSVLRRGMPTVNSAFSHQVSVIMGDYLYSRAMTELVRLDEMEPLRIIAHLTNEMTIGEMRQLLAHDALAFTEREYDLLIRSKTASLLAGACEVGAVGAPAAVQRGLASYGEALGMAFQIVDDLLDYTADEAATGKPSGLDLREHKVTLPLIAALPRMPAAARADVERLMETPEPSDDQIARVVRAVTEAGGLSYARDRAQRLAHQAEAALTVLPPSPAREALRAGITYVLERRR